MGVKITSARAWSEPPQISIEHKKYKFDLILSWFSFELEFLFVYHSSQNAVAKWIRSFLFEPSSLLSLPLTGWKRKIISESRNQHSFHCAFQNLCNQTKRRKKTEFSHNELSFMFATLIYPLFEVKYKCNYIVEEKKADH